MCALTQTVSPNVHSSVPRLQHQAAQEAAQQQHHHQQQQQHATAEFGQMSGMGSAIKRTMSEPVVSNDNVVCPLDRLRRCYALCT